MFSGLKSRSLLSSIKSTGLARSALRSSGCRAFHFKIEGRRSQDGTAKGQLSREYPVVLAVLGYVQPLVLHMKDLKLLVSPSFSQQGHILLQHREESMLPLETWNLMTGVGICMTQ